ncbi:hypothetical protein MTO96_006172 [Rhipicephalus appendiculatus]
MPDKAKQDSSAPDTPRIVEQLTALLERQATPHDSFRLPLAVPTYEGHTDKKSVADFLQELQDYRDAQALTNETLLLRVLPVALSGSAARWRRRQSFEMQEAQAGTLRYASSVEVEATTGASAQADHVLAAGETTGAGDGERMPIVGQHSTAPPGSSHFTQVLENLLRLLRGLRLVFKSSQARRRGPDAGCFGRHIILPPGSTAAGNLRQSNARPKGKSRIPFRSDNYQRNNQPMLQESAPRPITATVYSTIR